MSTTDSDPDRRWLAAQLPFVRSQLPESPARVLEIGCGPLGGFVPPLTAAGYDAVGIDPKAPAGESFHQVEFEEYDVRGPIDAVVACTSLHHVADLDVVIDRVAEELLPGGVVVVVEWAHERFDEATALWCFDRLGDDEEHGWLRHHRERWIESGQGWESYLANWAGDEGLHSGGAIVRSLGRRFDTALCVSTPYVYPDLDNVTEADEQAAIEAGLIHATGLRYVGRRSGADPGSS